MTDIISGHFPLYSFPTYHFPALVTYLSTGSLDIWVTDQIWIDVYRRPANTGIGLGDLTLVSVGTNPIDGSASITFGSLLLASSGLVAIAGESVIYLGELTVDANGTILVDGISAITLSSLILTATGYVGAGQPIELRGIFVMGLRTWQPQRFGGR